MLDNEGTYHRLPIPFDSFRASLDQSILLYGSLIYMGSNDVIDHIE